jgi:hypothetical protein
VPPSHFADVVRQHADPALDADAVWARAHRAGVSLIRQHHVLLRLQSETDVDVVTWLADAHAIYGADLIITATG